MRPMEEITIQEKLNELLTLGNTPKDLATKIGCHISTVYRIRDGAITDPSYSVGIAIDALYLKQQPHVA